MKENNFQLIVSLQKNSGDDDVMIDTWATLPLLRRFFSSLLSAVTLRTVECVTEHIEEKRGE